MKNVFFILALLFATTSAWATTWTVGPGGPPTYNYASIQAAINAETTVDGDVIAVAAGTYAGNITVNKSFITILGDPGDALPGPGPNAPVIDGGSLPGDAFKIVHGVTNLTIKGFEMRNFTSPLMNGIGNGISAWVGSTSNITIQDNYFHHLGYNGVLVGNDKSSNPAKWGDHSNWLIKNNIIENFGYIGFELTNTSNSNIEDNIIHLATPYIGAIFSSARRTETGLTIKNNMIDGAPSASFPVIYIYAYDKDMLNPNLNSVLIEGNAIATIGTPYQIYIRNIGTGTVTGVTVVNNNLFSLKNLTSAVIDASSNWWGSTDPTVVSSKISGVADYTPILMSGTDNDLGTPGFQPDKSVLTVHTLGSQVGNTGRIQEGINTVAGGSTVNVTAGTYAEKVTINKSVSLIGSPGAVLNGTGLGGNGFLIQAPNITINGFEIKNYQIGIRTYGGPASYGDLQILNCNIHHNTQNGMLFVYDIFNTVLLENNQITGNTQNGIGIANNATIANLHILNSSASSNNIHGLLIVQANLANVLIENSNFNNATSYGSCGITFSTTKSTVGSFTMTGGSLSGNTGGGLYVAQKPTTFTSFMLDGVTIQNNHESGILLGGGGSTGDLSVENCTFQGNAWEDFDLSGGWFGGFSVPNTTNISGNFFNGGPAWAKIYIGSTGAFGNINVNLNSFVPGAWRIYNTNAKIVDATCNWWGSVSPGGSTVTANVIKVPWLTNGTDNSTDPGFQPSVACVACNELACSITAIPGEGPYTGGDPEIIYLGYGPQSVTLSSTVSGGSATAYSWSGTAGLSCTTCASPVFTPTSEGMYEFTLMVTFTNGCTSTCSITICVLDIRVPGNNGKVYLCHVPPGNPNNPQTLSVNINAVPAHVPGHPLDHLGTCSQSCGNGPQGGVESGELIVSEDHSISSIVYPNPFTSDFTVTVETESQELINITIYDLIGRRLQEIKNILPNTSVIVANDLENGTYVLFVQQGDQAQKVKIIKYN